MGGCNKRWRVECSKVIQINTNLIFGVVVKVEFI